MKKTLKILSLIMIMAVMLTACGQKEEKVDGINEENSANEDEELVLNLEGGDWGYLSPYTHYSRGPGIYKMELIFDSMLERGEDGLIPMLAEKWDIDETATDYTFYIREGVKWQDGQPMTTEDIEFSFDYYKEHPPVSNDLDRSENDYIKEINLIDDHTINIKIEAPDATLLERFGMARIIPKHIWENVDDPIKFEGPEAVIGCGPYKLTDYNREQGAYKFEAFEDYWGNKPKADVIRFIPVSDPILAFENGEIDITGVNPDILSKYEDDPKYKLVENPAFWGYRILFNMEERPEFKEKNLRQAMAYSIDKDELIEKVGRGAGKVASPGYLPLEHSMYNENVEKYDFDLEKAKELLDGKEYEFSLLTGDSNEEVRIGELIKLNFEKVGITINITSADAKSRDAAIKSGDYELVLNGHGGWGNDADILRNRYCSEIGETPGFSNADIDKLANEQLSARDPEERKEIIFELQKVIAEEIPILTLYNTSGYTVYMPEKYDGWKHVFNHHQVTHNKISYLEME